MSAPPMVEEQEQERATPKVASDPMVGAAVLPKAAMPKAAAATSAGKSFSDLAEMPPLKEPFSDPPIQQSSEAAPSEPHVYAGEHPGNEEKTKVQPREVAEKALRQIVSVPPKLMLFSILGALGLISLIAIAILFHVRSEDSEVTGVARPTTVSELNTAPVQPAAAEPAPPQIQTPVPAIEEVHPDLKVRPVKKWTAKAKTKTIRAAPVAVPAAIVPGEALIDSTPQGARFQLDQTSDPPG